MQAFSNLRNQLQSSVSSDLIKTQTMEYLDINQSDHLSFLRARDPSILSGNFAAIRENIRTNLALGALQEVELEVPEEKNIQIHLRIKNAENIEHLYKIDDTSIHCTIPTTSSHLNNTKDIESIVKKFTFSHIFPPTSSQEEIFNLVVKPKVFKFINGENSTLMSYGASGSGKTFTIVGTVSEPGIIPRTLEYLFRTIPNLSEMPLVKPTQCGKVAILDKLSSQREVNVRNELLSIARTTIDERHIDTYRKMQNRLSTEPVGILDDLTNVTLAVWVSFSEIYNENIYDLLTPVQRQKTNDRPKLKLGSFKENTYIKNLTNVSISSGAEAYQILQYGLHNLKYASTTINSHSSRSHCIFSIKIAQVVRGTNISRLNNFNFCDLAGSERLKKTLNVGERLKESNNINTSLLVLGRCISCIRENQRRNINKVIPYRESKLTRLFQRALSGNEGISMIVNMNPTPSMFDESLHALNFSAIAKDVIVRRTPMKPKTKNRFSTYLQSKNNGFGDVQKDMEESEIMKLQDIIDKLYSELERVGQHCAEQELKIREEVIQEQASIIEGIREQYQQRIAAQEARHRRHIQEMRNMYLNSTAESEIINLDSSSDEEDYANKTKQEDLRRQLDESKLQVCSLKAELTRNLTILDDKEKELSELRQTIEDATKTYNEMQQTYEKKINDLLTENFNLKDVNSELSEQLDEYSRIIYLENEEILS